MIRFVATLVPVGYFLVLFCLPLVAVSTPSDAKVQFSNKKTFDRVTFEFEKPTKFASVAVIAVIGASKPNAAGATSKLLKSFMFCPHTGIHFT